MIGRVHGPGGSCCLGLVLRLESLRNQTASSVDRARKQKLNHASMADRLVSGQVSLSLTIQVICAVYMQPMQRETGGYPPFEIKNDDVLGGKVSVCLFTVFIREIISSN